jgi:hypothetical protein
MGRFPALRGSAVSLTPAAKTEALRGLIAAWIELKS